MMSLVCNSNITKLTIGAIDYVWGRGPTLINEKLSF